LLAGARDSPLLQNDHTDCGAYTDGTGRRWPGLKITSARI